MSALLQAGYETSGFVVENGATGRARRRKREGCDEKHTVDYMPKKEEHGVGLSCVNLGLRDRMAVELKPEFRHDVLRIRCTDQARLLFAGG